MKQKITQRFFSKVVTFVTVIALFYTSLYIPAGALAFSSDDTQLNALAEEEQQYVLVDAASISPGKEYIMLWNKALSGNLDDFYALSSAYSSVSATAIDTSYFNADKSLVSIPKSVSQQTFTWRVAYNTGSNPTTGYLFQDTGYGTFLRNNAGNLEVTKDPIGTSGTDRFVSCCFTINTKTESAVTYGQLISATDSTHFLRYSVGSNTFKLGTTATTTDVNNSCMYLYEKVEPSKYIWQLSDKLDSNSEYLICNAGKAGSGKILKYSDDRVVGEDIVTIESNSKGNYIASGDTANSIFYSYGLGDNTFWLDNYYDVTKGEATRIKSNALTLTANHVDSTYHIQFAYSNNTLTIKKVFGTDTYTICYNDGFKTGAGNLYLYKKVYVDSTGVPIVTPKPIATPVPTSQPTATPRPTATPVRTTMSPTIEERGYTSILTMSDYQKWNSDYTADNWDFLKPQLTKIVNGVYGAGVRPDYFLFGGDFSCLHTTKSSEEGLKQVTDEVYSKWTNLYDANSVIIQGNHDPAGTAGLASTGAYFYDTFIIYVINEDDYPSTQGTEDVLPIVQKSSDDFLAWAKERAADGETRPILLATHTGLHYDIDRTDGNNQYAYILFDAVNEAAKDLDIIFLFGHNHTNGDEQVGGSITLVNPGSELNVCTEKSTEEKSGTPEELNFTYMNYGYIGYIGDIKNNESTIEPTDLLTATDLRIYNDRITVSRYSANGHEEKYDGEIQRLHAKNTEVEPTATPGPQQTQTPYLSVPTANPGIIQPNEPVITTSPKPVATPVNTLANTTVKKPLLKVKSKKTVKKGKKITINATVTDFSGKIKWKVVKGKKLCKLSKSIGKSIKFTAKKRGNVKIQITCGLLKKVINIKIK